MASPSSTVTHLKDGKVTISTPRLLLREAVEGDVRGLYEVFSDPETMRYWSTTPHVSTEQTSTWISRMILSPQNGTTDFIITDRSSSQPIGTLGVWNAQEIGFILLRGYWGKGVAKEALLAVLSYLFDEEGQKRFEEITADVDPRNERSIGLLEAHGFVKTGFRERTFEIAGEWLDSLDLTLRRDDFMRRYKRQES